MFDRDGGEKLSGEEIISETIDSIHENPTKVSMN